MFWREALILLGLSSLASTGPAAPEVSRPAYGPQQCFRAEPLLLVRGEPECAAHEVTKGHGNNQTSVYTTAEGALYSPWVQAARCQRLGGEEYCAWTHAGFQGGEGISVVTTWARMSSLVGRLVFQNSGDDRGDLSQPRTSPPYVEAAIPGKDVGLVAARAIRAGERLMVRTPAVLVDGRVLEDFGGARTVALLADAAAALPPAHRAQFLNLSTHGDVRTPEEVAHRVFAVNRFRTTLAAAAGEDGGLWDFHSVFTEVSRLNHDCRPNSVYYFDDSTLTHRVYAVRDIMPGEELTVSYIDGFQPRSARQDHLSNHWGFICTCPLCTSEKHRADESDSRIAQILQLWRELDDYSPTSTATPEKAELLILLYELEDMQGRLQEAYYRAAIEHNSAGQATQAIKYARLCLDRGLAYKGPGRPFIQIMKELVRDPKAHSSWRSRLAKSD